LRLYVRSPAFQDCPFWQFWSRKFWLNIFFFDINWKKIMILT
jgi:hypothetical protein